MIQYVLLEVAGKMDDLIILLELECHETVAFLLQNMKMRSCNLL